MKDTYSFNSTVSEEIEPVRHYKGKKNSDIVNFPIALRREILSPLANKKLLTAPITTIRIILKILNDLSYDQFQVERNKRQLSLFEKDFMTNNNTYARFTYKVSDIDKNLNYNHVKEGLEFLENLEKGWHKAKNLKGNTISSYGGVISNANISKGEISFLMSSYWVERFLKICSYNPVFFETAWELSKMKQVLFYLWLLELPEKGTKVKLENLQEAYDYSYKDANTFNKSVLKPLRAKLDRNSNVSFNSSVKGNLINIKPYYTKDIDLNLRKETFTRQHITQKLHYWKTRHELSSNDIDILKSLINLEKSTFRLLIKAYDSFIRNCRINKKKATNHTGKEFIKLFQERIIEEYKSSAWAEMKGAHNAYPVIIPIS